jgi:hypothetical protein
MTMVAIYNANVLQQDMRDTKCCHVRSKNIPIRYDCVFHTAAWRRYQTLLRRHPGVYGISALDRPSKTIERTESLQLLYITDENKQEMQRQLRKIKDINNNLQDHALYKSCRI